MCMQCVNTTLYLSSKNFICPFMVAYALVLGAVGRPASIRNVDSSYFSWLLLGIFHKRKAYPLSSDHIFIE